MCGHGDKTRMSVRTSRSEATILFRIETKPGSDPGKPQIGQKWRPRTPLDMIQRSPKIFGFRGRGGGGRRGGHGDTMRVGVWSSLAHGHVQI